MRFRKKIKILPGFYLNISNSGLSSTIGVKGASINISKRGTYLNTSIPGTGFYNRQKIGGKRQNDSSHNESFQIPKMSAPLKGEIKSAEITQLSSSSMGDLKESLFEAYKHKLALTKELEETGTKIRFRKFIHFFACVFIIGFFIRSLKEKIKELEEYIEDLENQLKNCVVEIDTEFDLPLHKKYGSLIENYKELLRSKMIWDITSSVAQDMKATRSAATSLVTRTPVQFKFENVNIIRSTYAAFHFENKNGGDLYIYPAFVIVINSQRNFAIIDMKEFELTFSTQQFIEEDKVPSDTRTVGKTWAKVNKNGSPDKRFKDNYELPIVRYGQLTIKSKSGLNEVYSVSSYEKSGEFVAAFEDYQKLITQDAV